MVRLRNLLLVVGALVLSCDKGDPPLSTLSTEHNSIEMAVGDSWLFKRTVSYDVNGEGSSTLPGYLYYEIEKDTSIDGKTYLVLAGREYEFEDGMRCTKKGRFAIHLGDTVIMYEYTSEDDNVFPWLLKEKGKGDGISMATYDTANYSDLVYPLIYPLVKGAVYVYRADALPGKYVQVYRRYMGVEKVTVPAGTFDAYKMEWIIGDGTMESSGEHCSWIGKNGLVKMLLSGQMTTMDEAGQIIEEGFFEEITELIGHEDIDPDTLVP